MSPEDVDVVRRYYELLNAHDLQGCLDLLAPDIEVVQPSLPDGGTYRGKDGWLRWMQQLDAAWSDARWTPEEYQVAGDAVVVTVRFAGKGKHTAIEQEVERFQVVRVERGRITFTTGYGRRADALASVGLLE